MTMQMRVWNAFNRPGGKMGERAIGDITSDAVFVLALFADACLHTTFDIDHRIANRRLKGVKDNVFIDLVRECICQTNGLTRIECEIISHRPVGIISPG